jgi:glycosyltransferase involved in cell wall biosynthesis
VRVLDGILFFPRGGSAHVARSLSHELGKQGWDVRILSGSVPGGPGDAEVFYSGLDVRVVDFAAGDAPMHPSYEDHPGTPDRCFALVDDAEYRAHVAAWETALSDADAASFDVLLLNHLTPLNEAAARVAPGVPIVGHLHGTELILLEQIDAGAPAHWTHAAAWARRMRRWARQCTRLVVQTPGNVDRAVALLGIEPTTCVVVANGVDATSFRPRPIDRASFWRRTLVEKSHGWRPGAQPGSVAYQSEQVSVLEKAVILVAVGRYTAVKRLGLLIDAFARAEQRARRIPALVIVGGYPGECEAEHPWDAVQRSGARNIFLAGWQSHSALPDFLNAADAQVLASVREQFGLVLIEGMACGLPAIAVNRLGPAEIIEHGRTGWLVEPDDLDQLTDMMVAALDDDPERLRRGHAARVTAAARWGWPALAARMAAALSEALSAVPAPSPPWPLVQDTDPSRPATDNARPWRQPNCPRTDRQGGAEAASATC